LGWVGLNFNLFSPSLSTPTSFPTSIYSFHKTKNYKQKSLTQENTHMHNIYYLADLRIKDSQLLEKSLWDQAKALDTCVSLWFYRTKRTIYSNSQRGNKGSQLIWGYLAGDPKRK
jgi:hypothetical protein